MSSRSTTRSTGEHAGGPAGEFLDLVREREQAALAALAAATGDASLCALSRTGTPHPAAKFHEGSVAALAELRRTLTRQPGTAPADAVAAARDRWDEQHAGLAARGRDWAAYHAGGVEALDRLAAVARVTHTATDTS